MQDTNIILIVEKEIDLRGEYSAVEMLKSSGIEHNQACGIVETVMLYKENYFSRISKLKRAFYKIFLGNTGKDLESTFNLLCKHLLSTNHYQSLEEINQEIIKAKKSFVKIEANFGYRDDLYYYSSELKRKIIILFNLHYDNFPKSTQQIIMNILGKEKIAKSITQRTKYITQKLQSLSTIN